ncbi:hypothetical protein GGI11_000905 [Coemansia sp. RSA 2049]|nr:hypothetical protein GGI11_000905 [Coemansia sp. RSA 2049]
MNMMPNASYSGAGYSDSQNAISASQTQQTQQQQQYQQQHWAAMTLPPFEQQYQQQQIQLSPASAGIPIAGVPIAGGSPLQSFQLASVATSPMPGTPSSSATGSAAAAGLGGGGLQFSQSVVSPGAISTSSTFNDHATNPNPNFNLYQNQQQEQYSHNLPQQQQQQQQEQHPMPKLVEVPVTTHSYSYQPTTDNTQPQFPNVLLNGGPLGPLPWENPQTQPALQSAGIQKSKSRPPRNKSKFKRFRNAFIYYVNDQRDKVDDDTKRLKNREFLQLMSARWKTMPENERKPYIQLAEEDKKRFNEDVKRYGKYESRQRRYNKPPRSLGKTNKYTYPHGIYGFPVGGNSNGGTSNIGGGSHGQNSGGASAAAAVAAANLLYNTSGYGNVMPAQMNIGAAAGGGAPQTNLSQFYVGPPVQSTTNADTNANNASARLGALAVNNIPHSVVAPGSANLLAADIQRQLQQPSSLLSPSALEAPQRTSLSTNNSPNKNNAGNINTSLSPNYQWDAIASAGDNSQVGMISHGRHYAAYYQQQQQQQPLPQTGGSYLQVPTGTPISHALTEPAFHMTGQNNPFLGQSQQQRQNQLLQQQQQYQH